MKTLIEIMARSVGARPQQNKNCDVEYLMDVEALERFAELVRADEREACAVIAETPIGGEQDDITMEAKDRVAAAIRARSNT